MASGSCTWLTIVASLVLLVTPKDVQGSIYSQYRAAEIRNFSSLLIRERELFLGARNYVVRLDARSFTELSRMPLLPPDQNLMYDVLLENYVRIAPIGSESDPGDRFLSCETNAAESTCRLLPYKLETARGSDMQQSMITDYHASDRSYTASATQLLHNNVLLAIPPLVRPAEGLNVDVYVGGPYGRADSDVGVVRVPFGRDERKIDFPGVRWFSSGAAFVAAFELDGGVYFFLREHAPEGRVGVDAAMPVYSRVVRVCNADCGTEAYVGDMIAGYRWDGLLKTRLLCSASPSTASSRFVHDQFTVSSAPLEFNYLHHVTFDADDNLFYATFTSFTPDTPDAPTSVDSAVCVFSRQSIVDGFSGHLLADDGRREGRFSWYANRSSLAPASCPLVANESCPLIRDGRRARREARSASYGRQQLLLANAIKPSTNQALLLAQSTQFNQLATLSFTLNSVRFSVLFILDFHLVLRKYLLRVPASRTDTHYVPSSSCFLETFDLGAAMALDDQARRTSIYRPTAFRLYNDSTNRWLVATFGDRVVRVAASDCARHADRAACEHAQDVLCGWSVSRARCGPIARFDDPDWRKTSTLLQFAANASCRAAQTQVDWSAWSDWQSCNLVADYSLARSCECRTRQCAYRNSSSWHTPPSGEPDGCQGVRTEVRNCAVHGNWSTWSPWSSCPAQCQFGVSTQSRFRNCSNPPPQFGGAACDGEWLQHRLCDCTPAGNQYEYSDWSPWRRASLARFSAAVRNCATDGVLNYSVTLLSRERDCVAQRAVDMCPQVQQSRLCVTAVGQENACVANWSTAAQLSDWGSWSPCVGSCDSGLQFRARACSFPVDLDTDTDRQGNRFCDVPLVEAQSCALAECAASGQVVATSWSDWSACYQSAENLLRTVRNRSRSCVLLKSASEMPDLRALTGDLLEPYKVNCPSHIATQEYSNCTVEAPSAAAFLSGLYATTFQTVPQSASLVANESLKYVATFAVGLLFGIFVGLLVAIIIGRCAHHDQDAGCASRIMALFCGADSNTVSKSHGVNVTLNPALDATPTPSTVRRAALSLRLLKPDGAAGEQPLLSSPRCDDVSTQRCDRINVPLPPLPVEHAHADPSLKTPRMQRCHAPHDGVPASSAYSSVSSSEHADPAQSYRAPVSPLRSAAPSDLRTRLLVSSPVSPPEHHESMQRSLRRNDPQASSHAELLSPSRFSKLANPSLARVPPSPTRCAAPALIASQVSMTDSQYAVPHAVIGNMDSLVANGNGNGNGTLPMAHNRTNGVALLANSLRSPPILSDGSQTPVTLTRHVFRAARAPSVNTEFESMDVGEQMRQITKQLLPDDNDAV